MNLKQVFTQVSVRDQGVLFLVFAGIKIHQEFMFVGFSAIFLS